MFRALIAIKSIFENGQFKDFLVFALAKEGHQVCRRRDLCLKFSFVLMSICECKSDNMKGKEGEGELCVFRALLSIIFV